MLADDDDDTTPAVGAPQGQTSQQPAWMRQLHDRCMEWIGQLPAVSNQRPAVTVEWDLTKYYRVSTRFLSRVQTTPTLCIDYSSEKERSGRNFFPKSAETFRTS